MVEQISIDMEVAEIERLYGNDAYKRARARRLYCVLHPDVPRTIYVVPAELANDSINEMLANLDETTKLIKK